LRLAGGVVFSWQPRGPHLLDNGAETGNRRARTQGRMDNRDPIDVPFLVFVIIVTVLVVALGVAIYPQR
jgi:hypothetical protein